MELPAQYSQHIHSRVRLALQQNGDVLAVHLNANRFFDGYGFGLMGCLLEHGGEAEELAKGRLIDHHLLVILVHGGNSHTARDHDVSSSARVADLVDALPRGKRFQLDLSGQHRSLVIVQQRKQRNTFQNFRAARHGSPRPLDSGSSTIHAEDGINKWKGTTGHTIRYCPNLGTVPRFVSVARLWHAANNPNPLSS